MKKTLLSLAAGVMALSASAGEFAYTVDPAEGVVESLKTVTFTFQGVGEIDINTSSDLFITHDGTKIDGVKAKADGNQLVFTLAEEQTMPGIYEVTIMENAISSYTSDWEEYIDDNNEIVVKYEIKGGSEEGLDFTYTSSLPEDELLAYFGELTLDFPEVDKVVYTGTGLSVKKDGVDIKDVKVETAGNKLTLSLEEPLNFVEAVVEVLIPAGSIEAQKGDVTATNEKDIKLTYKMATPVEYDLTLAITTPKPNADGEISAEKSLESIFFACEQKGLGVSAGTEKNVTITSEEGDFSASGRLKKAAGLNANFTYFSAAFGKEPQYNGKYIITIDRGAFGTEAWIQDPNFGHSNDKIELTFTLVDGKDRAQYVIEPVSINPEEGTYKSGEEIANVTLKFEDGVKAVSGAKAILAGVDNKYSAEASFKDAGNGEFTVSFDPVPTENGKYIFSVPSGSFGNDSFVSTGKGEACGAININYTLSVDSGIESITMSDSDSRIYNLQGVEIKSGIDRLPAGIYIIGGKKVKK